MQTIITMMYLMRACFLVVALQFAGMVRTQRLDETEVAMMTGRCITWFSGVNPPL